MTFSRGWTSLGAISNKRHQDKAALAQPRMRHGQFRSGNDQVPGQQDVDIDRPVAIMGIVQIAALQSLIFLAFLQEFERRKDRLQGQDHVQEQTGSRHANG